MSRWCSGCIGPSEGLGPGSNPGRDTDCPRGVAEARDPAKVVGQVRLLAGTLTLEPDGEAAGCNPAEVGSIPTGVSLGEPGALATGGTCPWRARSSGR